jgi:hypothetical protein
LLQNDILTCPSKEGRQRCAEKRIGGALLFGEQADGEETTSFSHHLSFHERMQSRLPDALTRLGAGNRISTLIALKCHDDRFMFQYSMSVFESHLGLHGAMQPVSLKSLPIVQRWDFSTHLQSTTSKFQY